MPDFASKYERTPEGWIKFPRDVEYRRKLFPNPKLGSKTDVFQHPAKMQLYLVEELVDYLSNPGDWILDPFGGTGSTALAATRGRNVVLVDVQPEFGEIIHESAETLLPGGIGLDSPDGSWTWLPPSGNFGMIKLLIGDNRQVLAKYDGPQFNAVITSPPYSTALANSGRLQATMMEEYKKSPFNMGNLNPLYWEHAMKDLWGKMGKVLLPGAKVAMVNKDMMKSGGRELLSLALIRHAEAGNFKFTEWFKWSTPGTNRTRAMLAKGADAVLDEDVIIFERQA